MKTILFDFDGTIANSQEVALSVMNKVADKYHIARPTAADIQAMRKMSIKDRCKRMKIIEDLYRSGYPVGIVSSNSESAIREFLEHNQMSFIKNIYCSHRLFHKDVVLKRFMKDQKVKSSDIVYVGDEHRDIVAGKKIGVKVIWVEWGFDTYEAVAPANPDFQAKTPQDILKFIRSLSD
jgi:phosphoglycolate phosphatase